MHVGLLHHRGQGLLCQAARFQKAREVAAFPELGDLGSKMDESTEASSEFATPGPRRRLCPAGRPVNGGAGR